MNYKANANHRSDCTDPCFVGEDKQGYQFAVPEGMVVGSSIWISNCVGCGANGRLDRAD